MSDDDAQVLKSTLAAGTTIGGHDYLVLDQMQLGFGLDGQLGGDLWLIAADPATGRPLRFADHVTFDATDPGVTLGRWPDGDPDQALFPMTEPTFGAANSGPVLGDVVISEIHYHPAPPPDGSLMSQEELEFVEVTNRSGTGLVLGGWQLDGFGFQFPDGTILAPGGNGRCGPFRSAWRNRTRPAAFREIYCGRCSRRSRCSARPAAALQRRWRAAQAAAAARRTSTRAATSWSTRSTTTISPHGRTPPTVVAQSLTRVSADAFGGLAASWIGCRTEPRWRWHG